MINIKYLYVLHNGDDETFSVYNHFFTCYFTDSKNVESQFSVNHIFYSTLKLIVDTHTL